MQFVTFIIGRTTTDLRVRTSLTGKKRDGPETGRMKLKKKRDTGNLRTNNGKKPFKREILKVWRMIVCIPIFADSVCVDYWWVSSSLMLSVRAIITIKPTPTRLPRVPHFAQNKQFHIPQHPFCSVFHHDLFYTELRLVSFPLSFLPILHFFIGFIDKKKERKRKKKGN